MYEYKYPRPSMTADAVVFGWENERLHLLLIQRVNEPFKGCWAFPGGFMDMDETVEACAVRELDEETSMYVPTLRQFHCFSRVDRDPRGRTLSVASIALVHKRDYNPVAGDDAGKAQWFDLDHLPQLAFDHHDVVDKAKRALILALDSSSITEALLPEEFTIEQYYQLCRSICKCLTDRDVIGGYDSFAHRVNALELLQLQTTLEENAQANNGQVQQLYSFRKPNS